MPPVTDSATVRSDLVRALRLDLVGPGTGDEALAHEVLSQAPSRLYLTGLLVPLGAPEQQRSEVAADDELDTIDEAGGSDDAVTPEPGPARRAFLPSFTCWSPRTYPVGTFESLLRTDPIRMSGSRICERVNAFHEMPRLRRSP